LLGIILCEKKTAADALGFSEMGDLLRLQPRIWLGC
jgi:hypothetical protein